MSKYIGIRQQKNCNKWSYRIHFKLPDGTEIGIEKGGFETEQQAVVARFEKITELVSQENVIGGKFFGEIYEEYIETLQSKSALKKKYNSYYNTHIKSILSGVLAENCLNGLKLIQKRVCSNTIDGRSENKKTTLTRQYVLGLKAMLTNIFDFAYNNKYIKTHPMYLLDDWTIKQKIDNHYIEPLFAYLGNKHRLLPYLIDLFPPNIERFVDLFSGSAVVGVNVKADKVLINEPNLFLLGIYKGLHTIPPERAWNLVMSVVNKYCLSAENEQDYYVCRDEYNQIPYEKRVNEYWYWGLCLVYHSFNRSTVQFNQELEYNAPFGSFKVNMTLAKNKFIKFAEKLYQGEYEFSNLDYKDIPLNDTDFVYLDPPYLITTATYNKGWTIEQEKALYAYLEKLNEKGIKWAFSNVLQNNGVNNVILREWINKIKSKYPNIHLYYLNAEYSHANFRRKNKGKTTEIVLTNY